MLDSRHCVLPKWGELNANPSTGTHWKAKQGGKNYSSKPCLCTWAFFTKTYCPLDTFILICKFQQEELTLRHAELKNEDVKSKILLLANLLLPQTYPRLWASHQCYVPIPFSSSVLQKAMAGKCCKAFWVHKNTNASTSPPAVFSN